MPGMSRIMVSWSAGALLTIAWYLAGDSVGSWRMKATMSHISSSLWVRPQAAMAVSFTPCLIIQNSSADECASPRASCWRRRIEALADFCRFHARGQMATLAHVVVEARPGRDASRAGEIARRVDAPARTAMERSRSVWISQ